MVRSIYEIDPAEIKMQKVQDIQDDKPKASKRKPAAPRRVDPDTVPDETVQKPKRVRKPKGDTQEPVAAEEPKPKPARKKVAPKQETTPAQSESSGVDNEEAKPKKSRKKKAEEPVAPEPEAVEPPAKKPRTEKQIAADLKRKEAALAKREQLKAEKEARMEEALALQEKAREKAEKRKAAAAARKAAKGESSTDKDELPGWFKNYVKTVAKKEQEFVAPEEKPKVHKEVLETAKKQWGDGMVRDQLSDELSHHQRRMYAMIFPNRAGGF